MTYTIEGIITDVTATRAVGQTGINIRDVRIDTSTDARWPNVLELTAKKDRCALLDGFGPGDNVRARISLDGRKWEGANGTRYFTTLTLWGIERIGAQAPQTAPAQAPAEPPADTGLPF